MCCLACGTTSEYIEVSTPLDFERRLLHPQGGIYGLFSDMTTLAMFRPRSQIEGDKEPLPDRQLDAPRRRGAHHRGVRHRNIEVHHQRPRIGGADMKKVKKVVAILALAGAVAAWFSASESTRRYLVYIGKQVPYLPYRYFI